MRRQIQDGGAEVIHLGHNRSVMTSFVPSKKMRYNRSSSYQYIMLSSFPMVDLPKERNASHIKNFGGGWRYRSARNQSYMIMVQLVLFTRRWSSS